MEEYQLEEGQEVPSISGDRFERLLEADARSLSHMINQLHQVKKRQASIWESI